MCVRAIDYNISSKQEELKRLLETLRIKAETHVLVWDHLANMIQQEDGEKEGIGKQYKIKIEQYDFNVNGIIFFSIRRVFIRSK